MRETGKIKYSKELSEKKLASVSAVSVDSDSAERISLKTKKDIKEQYRKAEKIKHHYFRTFYYSFGISFIVLGALAILFFIYKQDKNFFGFADRCYEQSIQHLERHNNEKAIELLEECLEIDPAHTEARTALVNLYTQLGKINEAIDLLTDGIEITPRNETYYQKKIQLLTKSDRISEAEEFINSISASYIIVKLSETRPQNVVMTPDPGTYDTPVAVNLISSDKATVYYTLDGSDPTTHSNVYNPSSPPVVEKGTVTIRAFAMNVNGMISDEYKATYRIYSENSAYIFLDDKIEQMVRTSINKPTGTIYYRDLQSVKRLSNEEKGDVKYTGSVRTLEDLVEMTNLTELTIANEAELTDFTPLQQLKSLTSLDVSGCGLSDASVNQIFSVRWLNVLKIDGNFISDLSGIKNMSVLREFSAANNSLKDISAISGLAVLKSLDLSNNLISDIFALSDETSLKVLNLSSNLISDISSLSYLTMLTELDLSTNSIKQLNAISRLPNVEILAVGNNPIEYLSPISEYYKLISLKIDGTAVTTLGALSDLSELSTLDCTLTAITDFSSLAKMNVRNLILSQSEIRDLSFISLAKSVQNLDLSINPITDVSPLLNMTNLSVLNLSNSPVANIGVLTACSTLESLTCSGVAISSSDELALSSVGIKVIK